VIHTTLGDVDYPQPGRIRPHRYSNRTGGDHLELSVEGDRVAVPMAGKGDRDTVVVDQTEELDSPLER
jgi:hypothetical protein